MENVIVNGVEYAPVAEMGDHVAVIAERGWIFEGRQKIEGNGDVRLTDAHVVRSWSNGLGIGGLADPEHKDDYILDDLPNGVIVASDAIIATVPLGW